MMSDTIHSVEERATAAEGWLRRTPGWLRIVRNTVVGYVQQAGPRMAAALSYYSIFVGGPILVLSLAAGTVLFGDQVTRDTLRLFLERVLPPGAEGPSEVARVMVQTSTPAAGLAMVAGVFSLMSFTRSLTTCLNVILRVEGTEPMRRTILVGPLLLVAVFGLLWGAWSFELAVDVVKRSIGWESSRLAEVLFAGVVPLILAFIYFAIILAVVPRMQLARSEILVPAALGATLWEAARHIFGWLMGAENPYLNIFGPLGGIVALLAWVYLSCAILVMTGQFTWAFAMERRGRGGLAAAAPRQAGPEGWLRPFTGDNAVNEDHPR